MTAVTVAILTVSDSTVAGTREDLSGPALTARCEELGWVVVERSVVADEEAAIYETIVRWADARAATLILTTGGTGVARRDVTPEATRRAVEREIPGMAELMRLEGRAQTKFSILSRAVVGTRGWFTGSQPARFAGRRRLLTERNRRPDTARNGPSGRPDRALTASQCETERTRNGHCCANI